ncbi:striatin-4 [Caloenas nicobarica]|uniref:striatin-4 n=1 Tax=Caloenas nicobarica TaxID=187106 RepID=UPI0032B804A9
MAAERAAAAAPAPGTPPPGPGPGSEPAGRGGLSLPGILHFIQHEWARFEAEKGRWEAERAELQAQVAFLQGERKGQENLKTDLVRRIKMLEFALKQERSKYHKLKFGADGDKKAEPVTNGPGEVTTLGGDAVAWKEGRQLLRQYLEEVGYSDTILDMRSRRVRALLGRGGGPPKSAPPPPPPPPPASLLLRRIEEQIQRNAGREPGEGGGTGGAFPPPEDEDSDEDEDAESPPGLRGKERVKVPPSPPLDDDDNSEDALGEFHFLGAGDAGGPPRPPGGTPELERLRGGSGATGDVDGIPPKTGTAGPPRPREGSLGMSDVFILDGVGDGDVTLGDLAGLTVTNDNELGCDVPEPGAPPKKTWSPKFTLRSHYDAVRALAFVPNAAALVTASEDATIKLWNLHKPLVPKKSAALDLEPVYAFRGHRGAVLAVAVAGDGGSCVSGGVDGDIRRWRLPDLDLDLDPYDGYDPGDLSAVLRGHGDAVWAVALSPGGDRLASCSADGTVRLWDPRAAAPLRTYHAQSEHGVPTSVTFSATQPCHLVVAFRTGVTALYDVTAARPLLLLDTRGGAINQVVCHPGQPVVVTAGDDRAIRFLDTRAGHVVHSMVAHLDAVTCLAIDPSGGFLMSGSHDCSLRLWHWGQRACVQELPAHRRRHDEGVLGVTFHPQRALGGSAGADGLAKVFV